MAVFKNGHKIKITQPNSMILVSFSSAEDAVTNDVKHMTLLARKVLKNPPFRFFFNTLYLYLGHEGATQTHDLVPPDQIILQSACIHVC